MYVIVSGYMPESPDERSGEFAVPALAPFGQTLGLTVAADVRDVFEYAAKTAVLDWQIKYGIDCRLDVIALFIADRPVLVLAASLDQSMKELAGLGRIRQLEGGKAGALARLVRVVDHAQCRDEDFQTLFFVEGEKPSSNIYGQVTLASGSGSTRKGASEDVAALCSGDRTEYQVRGRVAIGLGTARVDRVRRGDTGGTLRAQI
jgi:hypothetical protein